MPLRPAPRRRNAPLPRSSQAGPGGPGRHGGREVPWPGIRGGASRGYVCSRRRAGARRARLAACRGWFHNAGARPAIPADASKRGHPARFHGYPDGSNVESWRFHGYFSSERKLPERVRRFPPRLRMVVPPGIVAFPAVRARRSGGRFRTWRRSPERVFRPVPGPGCLEPGRCATLPSPTQPDARMTGSARFGAGPCRATGVRCRRGRRASVASFQAGRIGT